MESGVVTTLNAWKLLYRGYNYAADETGIHEHWYSRPLSLLAIVKGPAANHYIHEYYGHGSVLREFGFNDAVYTWGWSPRGGKNATCTSQEIESYGTTEQKRLYRMGGLASTQLYLLDAEKEMYLNGRMTLIFTQVMYGAVLDLAYIGGDMNPQRFNNPSNGGDSAQWLRDFKAGHRNNNALAVTYADKSRDAVKRAAALNPAYYWSAATFIHYLWTGSDSFYAPMLPVAGMKFGFSPKVNITPLGPENYYYFFARRGGMLVSVYRRTGESPEGDVKGYGAELGPVKIAGLELTPSYDHWSLPSSPRLEYSQTGYNAQLKLDLHAYKALSLTGKASYKTKGYMLGQPSHRGFYAYAGAALTF